MNTACNTCKQPALQRCSRCLNVYYCSREHQKLDWRQHRSNCFSPFKVSRCEALGRYFVAERDLQPGDVVLREVPIVTGPPPINDCLVCVACYQVLKDSSKTFSRCPRCGWSVCSQNCADSDVHFPECQLTCNNRGGEKVDVGALLHTHPVYYALTILRCLLLRDSNPQAWNKLQQLESHCGRRKAIGLYEKERQTIARFLLSYFRLENDFTEEDVLRMCGIVQVNNYPVRLIEPYYLAVYNVASFVEHNCVPNCSKVFSAKGNLMIKVVVPVTKGEHLSICYTDPRCGTRPRRGKLATELLACRCRRCCDPTELQSFFSALMCRRGGCSGCVLPEQVLTEDINNNSDIQGDNWKCKSCGDMVPGNEVSSLLQRVILAAIELDKTDVSACENFLASQAAVLHANHYLLLPARLTIASRNLAGVSDSELAVSRTQLRQLLWLCDLILPAENAMRGLLLYQLHTALLVTDLRKARCEDTSLQERSLCLQESKQFLQLAAEVLCDEPVSLPTGRLGKRAQEQLLSFNSKLEDLAEEMALIHSPRSESPQQVATLAN